ncbi:uncharacterized protein LAESUDRAFT_733847 [Laetiporus sulphureus 93-53]|uniref:Uncharacterized protein n=1 Tax=Laetiporus sulphureus 93-53 TaxID=1314785 RepID=A0A165HN02_9APHY|nr:uncharacterized protein LAESUDRAFT_733847 [Laetiporus sulphureus 93-53]KZT11949.1 hypothetical protein LAESUDRAFT_733847 [Laetiporus sulphureus 93-53]
MFSRIAGALLASLLATGRASPISLVPPGHADVVISPDITSPTLLTVWTVGSTQTITWDVSKVPQTGANATGLVLLGYSEDKSENLDIQSPLATQFLIGDGQVDITVPNVTTRNDYIVVLFGDSGNASPTFTITSA